MAPGGRIRTGTSLTGQRVPVKKLSQGIEGTLRVFLDSPPRATFLSATKACGAQGPTQTGGPPTT